MTAYYNEFDPFVAQWLRNLIAAGHIADGEVDERSITEVQPDDLQGFTQCHFFAGIGGWSYALRLAGWPDDRSVWTGSCPCQDFSCAGNQAGFDGARDLWPAWYRLIREREPPSIFGEQVDDSLEWYDRTAADMEAANYRFGSLVIPACAVGADHERARLWFVADNGGEREQGGIKSKVPWERRFPWGKNGRGVEDLRERCPISEPLLRRLGDGVPAGLDLLRGFGNAIVPQVAAEFIGAYMEAA